MRSNTYTLVFTSIITIILGFFLSLAASSLKDIQDLNVENVGVSEANCVGCDGQLLAGMDLCVRFVGAERRCGATGEGTGSRAATEEGVKCRAATARNDT